MRHRSARLPKALVALVVALILLGCSTKDDSTETMSVVVDTDMGIDDVRALMFLLESDGIDIRAVTVSGSGLARCPDAAVNAAALLRTYDRSDVPVACGPRAPLVGYNAAPTAWRDEATTLPGLELDRSGLAETIGDADALLRETLATNDGLVILALGPLTNLAPVLSEPDLASAVSEVRLMGGAIDAGGNTLSFTNFVAEFNIWIDPVAAQQVLDSGVAVSIIPLDATNAVPISPVSVALFDSSETRSGGLLSAFYERNPLQGGVYHWDDLAAATLIDPGLVQFQQMPIVVTTDASSDELGRTARAGPGDGVTVRVAMSADQDGFERLFFRTVAGVDHTTLEAWVPEATITFDGIACSYDGPDPPPSEVEVEIMNTSSTPALGVIVGVYDPGTTREQADAFIEAGTNRPPPYIELLSVAPLPTRTSSIWVLRDLPDDVSMWCAKTANDVSELAGARLPD